jgi:hypothetical protein
MRDRCKDLIRNTLISCAVSLILTGCGSRNNDSGGGASNSTTGNAPSLATRAQGLYAGTISSGFLFSTIVLDGFYAAV